MNNGYVITIGREYGSGGREIGEKVAEKLGIPWYDKELLAAAAKKSGFTEQIFQAHDETVHNSLLYALVTGIGSPPNGSLQPLPVRLYLEQFNTIRELASQEDCLFIGRCADYALRDRPRVVNVFVHAPLPDRIQRVCRRNQVDERKARDLIRKQDKSRASYYSYYTDQRWGNAKNYDLTFDTSNLGIDGSVSMILHYLSVRETEDTKDLTL